MADHDRIEGAAKNLGGKVKEAAGKVTGDTKLQAEGKADQVEGKVQNAVGGVKDSLRDKD
ncbi:MULTISPECIES: CsbD family protein [unclassified Brevundimonas]|uniref:CsbD family protein n=1 Tax=unclassified Brevundimonas TaxID=2622653 RepID=UPI000E8ECDC3|nr:MULTISPECIES: CsbD family protein [unclassified Brevundimonas]MCK6104386.1 CsbD family protein [Brevundimonas sp. EYE_349]HBI17788.1 CsbD family protein [Brevundimonas sp.]